MIKLHRIPLLFFALLLSLALALAACGDDDEEEPTATPTDQPTATASPEPTATESPTDGPSDEITLTITSVTPDPAANGEEIEVVFETAPGAAIGLRVTDPEGTSAAQAQLEADDDGIATYHYVVDGDPGTWTVDAAAAETVQGLLALQQNPVAGPHSDAATFTVE